MKKIAVLIQLIFLCGLSFGQGIYTPVNPTIYGQKTLRSKADSAQHVPEKTSLVKNTLDTTAQIFYNKSDSSVWAYSKARGYFKLGASGGNPLSYIDGYTRDDSTFVLFRDNGDSTEFTIIGNVNLDSLNSNFWSTNGNAITAGKFIGTTNAESLVFKTNNQFSGSINENSGSVSLGKDSYSSATGDFNTAIGLEALRNGTSTSERNTGIGAYSLNSLSSGSRHDNTAIGFASLEATNANNNVGLGTFAGKYNTSVSNQIFINNKDRSSYTGDTTLSQIWISEDPVIGARIKVNGHLQINDGTQGAGKFLMSDANGVSIWATPSSSGTDTITNAGFSLTKSIVANSITLNFDSSTGFHTQNYNDLRYGSLSQQNANIAAIAQRVLYTDTASMLSKYLQKIDTTGKWQPVGNYLTIDSSIYKYDGTLTSDRTISAVDKNLLFLGDNGTGFGVVPNSGFTLLGDILGSVNENIFTIDDINNRLTYYNAANTGKFGINTTPDSAFTLVGGMKVSGGIRFTGLPTGVGTKALRIDATGNLSVADTTLADGDKGDVVVAGGGSTLTVESVSGELNLKGITSPATYTSDQTNVAYTGSSIIRVNSNSDSLLITSISGGTDGRIIKIVNVGATDIVLQNDDGSTGTAANRIDNNGTDVIIPSKKNADLLYDNTLQRWVVTSNSVDDLTKFRRQPVREWDYEQPGVATANFPTTAIASGTAAYINTEAGHPGVLTTTSSATTNSGHHSYYLGVAPLYYFQGGETYECVYQPQVASNTNTTTRFGFLDATTSADAVDGAYFEIPSGSLNVVGKTSNNNTRTTSATLTTLAVNTWYRFVIKVNRGANSIQFNVYDANGVLLSSQPPITTNIPNTSSRVFGAGYISTNSGTSATLLGWLDRQAFQLGAGKPLNR